MHIKIWKKRGLVKKVDIVCCPIVLFIVIFFSFFCNKGERKRRKSENEYSLLQSSLFSVLHLIYSFTHIPLFNPKNLPLPFSQPDSSPICTFHYPLIVIGRYGFFSLAILAPLLNHILHFTSSPRRPSPFRVSFPLLTLPSSSLALFLAPITLWVFLSFPWPSQASPCSFPFVYKRMCTARLLAW